MRCAALIVLAMAATAIGFCQDEIPALPQRMPYPTFEGTLKTLTKKEIVIQLQSEQVLSIRRDHKTKFVEKNKEIKPEKIALGTPLAIDVKEDADVKPLAVRVVVNPPPPKAER